MLTANMNISNFIQLLIKIVFKIFIGDTQLLFIYKIYMHTNSPT